MKTGLGIADITPPLGTELVGYYYKRNAQGIHDRLYARTLFLDDGETRAGVISFPRPPIWPSLTCHKIRRVSS